jgi:signal peptide peptidase SppA
MPNAARGYDHVLSFCVDHPWAITRPMLSVIAGILSRRIAGHDLDQAALDAALVNRQKLPQPAGDGAVAIIPVYGVIAPRINMLSDMSGGTTFETLTAQLREVMGNKTVTTVVFDIDSPGGNVAGMPEFAALVREARAKKPIIAQIQYTGASAAYAIAASCTKIYAAPSAVLGSVGVFTIHEDLSKALEMEGIKITYIAAGKYKVDGNETEPLAKDAEARIRDKVNQAYNRFLKDISAGRGVPVGDVASGYGEGDTVTAADGLALGMIDGIATLDDTLARVMSGKTDDRAARALISIPPFDTTEESPTTATSVQDRRPEATLEHDSFALQIAAFGSTP